MNQYSLTEEEKAEYNTQGKRIRFLRIINNLTYKDLSDLLGLTSRQTVYHYEAKETLRSDTVKKCAKVFRVSTAFILCRSDYYNYRDSNLQTDDISQQLSENTQAIKELIEEIRELKEILQKGITNGNS